MLQMTEDAGDLLTQYLKDSDKTRNAAVRFVLEDGEFSLEFDRPHPGDTQFLHAGRLVLLMDRAISESLANNTLDVTSTPKGQTLRLV